VRPNALNCDVYASEILFIGKPNLMRLNL
jgi:hypothetical protein